MAENYKVESFYLTKLKFRALKDLEKSKAKAEDEADPEIEPIFSERFDNLAPSCFSCKDEKIDVVLSLFQGNDFAWVISFLLKCSFSLSNFFSYFTAGGNDGKFEIDIAIPGSQRFEIVDLHDVQISLFQGNEDEGTKLAEFNQKFPENLGLRDEPENTGDKNEEELVDDVYSFRIDDSLKKYPADDIQEKFELAGKAFEM